jgi:peptidoglycan/LPS O-acetylase OafA/YrhL
VATVSVPIQRGWQDQFRRTDSLARIPALDGIRGLAILMVMFFHALVSSPVAAVTRLDDFVDFVLGLGWAGVHVFFVLSGFLITGILLDARGGQRYFRTFYTRRILRIFPLYYGLLAVILVAEHVVTAPDFQRRFALAGQDLWYWLFLPNILDAVRADFGPVSLSVSWSLAIEEQFYLVWPLLVLLLNRRQLLGLCAALVIGAPIWRAALLALDVSWVAVYTLTPTHLDGLAVGAFITVAMRSPRGETWLMRWRRPIALLAVLGLAAVVAWHRSPHLGLPGMQVVGYSAFALLSGVLLTLAIRPGRLTWLRQALEWRVLRTFGKYSYALYLFHQPWAVVLRVPFVALGVGPVLGSALPIQAIFSLAVIAPMLGAAWLSWNLYESRFLALTRLVPYHHRAPGAEGGEGGIRTHEGLHLTRFPGERHKPD